MMKHAICHICGGPLARVFWWPEMNAWFGTCLEKRCQNYQSTVKVRGECQSAER